MVLLHAMDGAWSDRRPPEGPRADLGAKIREKSFASVGDQTPVVQFIVKFYAD
jgi:hypothetical protein